MTDDETITSIGSVGGDGTASKLTNGLSFTTFSIANPSIIEEAALFFSTGDLNSDGHPDIAFSQFQDTNYPNTPSPNSLQFLMSSVTDGTWNGFQSITTANTPVGMLYWDLIIGDFDGDGYTDDLALLATTPDKLPDTMTGGNQTGTSVEAHSNNTVGLAVQGDASDYNSTSPALTPQWMSYGAMSGLTTVPKAVA